ncbi:hypothetical protein FO131_14680 [Salmonella bongori]|uniref:adhesion domain-containing protein n=1 Tax=Salmonella bongori TaxID=54736 RepID=UPI00127572A3|nr:DUF823 domain-containing adhesin [Salmonella bongori]ECG8258546.1 hypothetical protein [Salmonella bongori serovar 48:i:-]ECG9253778.1 hypothetical protein [Salmonella bongori]EDP8707017.1 hypothetical protein [Salmonella bongori]EDP8724170.1 hypothetical protein [Salmonella bongori]EEO9369421.1 hypothetical protein [Salmonella bongori]
MDGKLHNNLYRFSLALLLMIGMCVASASASLKGGTWQELSSSTAAVNGTVPQADGAAVPVYQGSTLLQPGQTHLVAYTAMPRDFSVDASDSAMQAVNELDTEGDIFTATPLRWENQQPPTVGLLWADAETPDTPLSPQPSPNLSFCTQNLAGRHLVAWPEIETDDASPTPALYLWTATGTPAKNALTLLQQKIVIDIAPAEGDPVAVSADHVDDTLKASKVKVGESITLTVTTRGCDGQPVGNAPFVIRREDALTRKGAVNNNAPVHVGNTELTTTQTLYRGVTDAQGKATVAVTQPEGPGVKTHLIVSSENYPQLVAGTDVIFTVLTSPDSEQANMYGHMPEHASAVVDGVTYTFTRPALAAETRGTSGTVVDFNETWAQFNWSGADEHCDILPAAEQLVALRNALSTMATYPGWPVSNDAEYWSSTNDQLDTYHYAVHTRSGTVERESNSSAFLVSCVDKALPAAHPQISLSPAGPYKAQVGESIDLVMTVVDRDTKKPLPYRYMELFVDPATNRKGNHEDVWDNLRVTIESADMRASSPEHYTGITDGNGQAHLTLKHDNGMGVETPIRIVMTDDEGEKTELPFSVIFTVETSPDVDGANMYGHMQGVVDAGNLYKRPLLAVEASHKTGQQSENNEDWATFNSVEAANLQCGAGQVPDQLSLDHLYSENAGNAMETVHGWPTQKLSYISGDSDGTQTAHVNLSTGDDGLFTQADNYLTCSANEKVAMLSVYFNDDPTEDNSMAAEVGQQIKMNVRSFNALNNLTVPNAEFTITLSPARRRDGLATGFTDPSHGQLIIDGVAYGAGEASMTYKGMTDAQGNAEVIIEQPRGVGVLTPLNIVPVNSLITRPISRSVKFTVATSPDVATARMWGHMPETITVGDLTFERPKLADEVSAIGLQEEANENWARVVHADAAGNTAAGGCAANRLPRADQLAALYSANSGGDIHNVKGWPVSMEYWSATFQSASSWQQLSLANGNEVAGGSSDSDYVTCLASDNPAAASITLEPVDASVWYDNGKVHAVKVKKGDTLQLKVTVKDASGKPVPQAPFVLTRGDGYGRDGDKYVAKEGAQNIVTPVVIDGKSLAWNTTKMGMVTGTDGTIIINVTRPDTHGTLTALTATLYDNPAVSASIDTIFTVITSPDSDKAEMWGHMPPSLTAADGSQYQRPLLYNELSSTTNAVTFNEDNEVWAGFYGPNSDKTNPDACGNGYYPTASDLDSLYSKYPGQVIKTAQGWPVNHSYWSGTPASAFSTSEPYNYVTVDLGDGAHRNLSNRAPGDMQYQICRATPTVQAMQIALTSPLATDAVAQAVKVKNSETLPLIVTTTDAAGNPVGNVPFMLTRDAGTARNTSYTKWTMPAMTLTPASGSAVLFTSATTVYGVTGADGTYTLDLTETNGPGIKNVLTASLSKTPTVTSALPVIFTTITSPDSDQANMWGHMPETFSAGNGAEFKRPLLYKELPQKSIDSGEVYSYTESNESWYTINYFDTSDSGACSWEQMATMADYQSLYAAHPGGAVTTDLGLPVAKTWWAADRILKGQALYWQYINLKSGVASSISANGNFYYQLCLTAPRQKNNLVLTLTPWDDSKSAAVAKKGEQIAATITVTDSTGKPVSNAAVKITRGNAQTREGNTYTANSADDITLNDVQPSGASTLLKDLTSYLYAQTNAQGQITFTVSQNNGVGLKTPLNVVLTDDSSSLISKDVIFTVLTSPDSDKAVMWGHMPETVTGNGGVKFHRPLLAVEAPSGNGSYSINNESWSSVTATNMQKTGKTGCDSDYQPRYSDLQSLYDANPDGALGTTYGWPIDGTNNYWWASDEDAVTSTYQTINLSNGAKHNTTSPTTYYRQVCLVEPHVSDPATITLTSTAMDATKKAAVVKKGAAMPLTVTITDASGKPLANQSFTLMRGDALSRSGIVVTANNEDDLKLIEQLPSSVTSTMAIKGSKISATTGADGTATFALHQDNSIGLKTTLTAQLASKTAIQTSLDTIFTVLTSPDSDKANYWGHMPETVQANGKTLQRPLLLAELPAGITPPLHITMNNEVWSMAHTIDASTWDLAAQCGSLAKAPVLKDLEELHTIFSDTGWPTSSSYSYLSQSPSGKYYCGFNQTTGHDSCIIDSKTTPGFAVCVR